MFDLIESEAVPAKKAFKLSNASYNSKLYFYIFQAYTMINNRLFTRNNRLFLSAAAENTFISEILTDYSISDKDIQEPINYPPICLHK